MRTLLATIVIGICFSFMSNAGIAQEVKWGDWNQLQCHNAIEFRLRQGTKTDQGYKIYVQFRSGFRNDVAFNWVMADAPGHMFERLRRGDGKRVVLDGESMSSGDDFDFANNTSAFVAIGYLRAIDAGKSEDLTRPYEICGGDMRRESVCMFCEYKPVEGCQMQIVPKNVHINRAGVLGVALAAFKVEPNEIKQKIVKNILSNWGGPGNHIVKIAMNGNLIMESSGTVVESAGGGNWSCVSEGPFESLNPRNFIYDGKQSTRLIDLTMESQCTKGATIHFNRINYVPNDSNLKELQDLVRQLIEIGKVK